MKLRKSLLPYIAVIKSKLKFKSPNYNERLCFLRTVDFRQLLHIFITSLHRTRLLPFFFSFFLPFFISFTSSRVLAPSFSSHLSRFISCRTYGTPCVCRRLRSSPKEICSLLPFSPLFPVLVNVLSRWPFLCSPRLCCWSTSFYLPCPRPLPPPPIPPPPTLAIDSLHPHPMAQ